MTTIHTSFDVYDDVEDDIRLIILNEINSVEPGRIIIDQNIWRGPVRPANDGANNHEGIWILLSGGRESIPFLGANGTLNRPTIQIRVRSEAGKSSYATGAKLARQAFLAVDQYPPPAFDAAGVPIVPAYVTTTQFVDIRSRSSAPLYIGMDKDGHHEWSFTVEAIIAD